MTVRTITLYSYKGGTGRTLLAANLAVFAAQLGRRVVIIDFDLEAPGLGYKLPVAPTDRCAGLVGWLGDALAAGQAPPDLDGYLLSVDVGRRLHPGGWLRYMPAGRAPSLNYFQDLERLHFDARLNDGSAITALLELQRQIESDLGAELLFIDARTGITASNRVTTRVLADEVVVLTLNSEEQLGGTRSVLRSLQPLHSVRTENPIKLHVVASRIGPRPGGLSPFVRTDDDEEQGRRIVEFLNEPASPLSSSLSIDRIHLLHTEINLLHREYISLAEVGDHTRTATHIDYMRLARVLLGEDVSAVAAEMFESYRAAGDAVGLMETARLFADKDVIVEGAAGVQRADADSALPPTLEQVETLRILAAVDDGQLPALAVALVRLDIALGELGRRDEGLAAIEEATTMYRQLAEANATAYLPDLAMSLNNLSARLGELGRRDEGLAAIEEATTIYRRLAEANPAAFSPNLATSLNNLSVDLGELGRGEEGLAAIEESTSIRRRLAEADPTTYRPHLATSLNNLSNRLGELGRGEEGLAAIEEATAIHRRLADAKPALYLPDLAMSLNNLSGRLGELGRGEEGLAVIEEATTIRRRLVEANPAVYLPDLAASLNNLSGRLGGLGRREEGLAAIEEAATIYRRLAEANPAAYLPDVAMSLNNLSVRLGELGRREEGLAAVEEATVICRRLAEVNAAAYLPRLAGFLNNLSNRLGEMGRREGGLAPIEEATTIYRRLAEANPAAYLPDLAMSLNNLSVNLGELGRREEGLTAIEEATTIYRRLAEANSAAYLPDLAMSLDNLADLLELAEDVARAGKYRAEAKEIQARLLAG
ncbi:MAG: tetratricopeptide repeat protein [Actinomycetia bacterium]|nr:tetratricopeptide repeat protein [Actinomycetes bacterium]